ncbi:hypothetical protein TI05_05325 [Achromatium sp. WMS3]|nr:hypothetical protein TI05_05325 [Achromatium sp. WMS3]
MFFKAHINTNGILTAKVPTQYYDTQVTISIHKHASENSSQWEQISKILNNVNALAIKPMTHQEIMSATHSFRESQ